MELDHEDEVQLADCLKGVLSQQLLPRQDGPGRLVAYEIMIAPPAVRNLIREQVIARRNRPRD